MCQPHTAILAVDTLLLQMPNAAASSKEEPEDSDFEVDVEDDDDIPLVRKKQKSSRYGFINCIINTAPSIVESTYLKAAARCCPPHQLKFAIWLLANGLVLDTAADNFVLTLSLYSMFDISYVSC